VILPIADHFNLFAARGVSLLCALAAIAVLVLVARDVFKRHPPGLRTLAVCGLVLLLLPNPLFADANMRGWNHSLPVLLTLLAFAACYAGARQPHPGRWFFAAGVCLGAAAGARSSMVTTLPAFVLAALLFPPGGNPH
jgi:4-amino-4-deoxy-L-arabinose transferase-like glycosyltransferase